MWIYFYHPSRGNSTNYYLILGPRDKAAPPTSQQIGQFPPKRVKYRHGHQVLFLFLPHPQESYLCSQPVRGNVRRTGRIFPEHVERSFLDPEYSFIAVRRIPRTRFGNQKFVQLRTNYVGLCSTNIPRTMFAKQMFAQLRRALRAGNRVFVQCCFTSAETVRTVRDWKRCKQSDYKYVNGNRSEAVTLFRTAVETSISEVHKLLGTGGVPSTLIVFFWL